MAPDDREKLTLDKKPAPGKRRLIPEKKPRLLMWVYLALFLALSIHFIFNVAGVESTDIEYSELLGNVSAGYVAEVDIVNDQRIVGKYTSEAIREGRVEVTPPPQECVADSLYLVAPVSPAPAL